MSSIWPWRRRVWKCSTRPQWCLEFGHDEGELDTHQLECSDLFVWPCWSWSLRVPFHKEKMTRLTMLGPVKWSQFGTTKGMCSTSLLLSLPTTKSENPPPSTWFHWAGRVGTSPLSSQLNREEKEETFPPSTRCCQVKRVGFSLFLLSKSLVERRGSSPPFNLVSPTIKNRSAPFLLLGFTK